MLGVSRGVTQYESDTISNERETVGVDCIGCACRQLLHSCYQHQERPLLQYCYRTERTCCRYPPA